MKILTLPKRMPDWDYMILVDVDGQIQQRRFETWAQAQDYIDFIKQLEAAE
jgi:hypothetical protein